MGRVKRAWYYQRKADAMERREQILRNRQPQEKPYAPRPERIEALYKSITQFNTPSSGSPSSLVFRVTRPNVGGLTAADLGLADLTSGTTAPSIRVSPIYPTTARWYEGTATPTRQTTQWGTKWIRYYESAQGGAQSHHSSPISATGNAVTAREQIATFTALFSGEKKTALLGAKNGRAYLVLERVRGVSANAG